MFFPINNTKNGTFKEVRKKEKERVSGQRTKIRLKNRQERGVCFYPINCTKNIAKIEQRSKKPGKLQQITEENAANKYRKGAT
jgi:hypothetical protein